MSVLRLFEEILSIFADTPLVSTGTHLSEKGMNGRVLTADVGGGPELGRHLRVHGDHDFFLGIHESISLLDLVLDPRSELFSQDHCADVYEPLLGHLLEVRIVGEVLHDDGSFARELKNALHREILVLRHIQGLDLFVLHMLFLSADDILDEVDRGVVCKHVGVSKGGKIDLP